MSQGPWWETFLYDGVDLTQQRALRGTAAAQSSLERRIELLEGENDTLRQALLQTHTIVNVLGRHLVDRGVVDGAAIQLELAEALRPPEAAPGQPAPAGSQYRGPQAARPPRHRVACAACSEQVQADTTHVTETGALCEACFTKAELARLEKVEDGSR